MLVGTLESLSEWAAAVIALQQPLAVPFIQCVKETAVIPQTDREKVAR